MVVELGEAEIRYWLQEEDDLLLQGLYERADSMRKARVGEAVHLRGLIEISNYCVRQCLYCGLRAANRSLPRYRMTEAEIMECVRQAVELGYGTVVLQAGEDYGIRGDWLSAIIGRIKLETGLAVTLSLGERGEEDLRSWREAGADRYLLKFETSDLDLYRRVHPRRGKEPSNRIAMLQRLRDLGYEVGSGVMVGIPGQTYRSLAHDIHLFGSLDLDMIGVGPYLPHPATPLGREGGRWAAPEDQQVPNTERMSYKVIALSRLVCPDANIPSTSALATLNPREGRALGLQRGANVIMPNLTPPLYRRSYQIYPGKGDGWEDVVTFDTEIKELILSLGRMVGTGRGDSPGRARRQSGLGAAGGKKARKGERNGGIAISCLE